MGFVEKVKKPVEAIQCSNTFSLLQRKMYNVLLANASGNLRIDATHRIAMKVLCQFMGYHSNDYKTIKKTFRELRRMDIEWDIVNENGNKVWTNTSPLSLARVIEGEGICEYEFTPSLVPYLDRPAQYAKFSLIIQSQFKSGYGLALYENCERYRNMPSTKAFEISLFRKLMGVKATEYEDFFALKRRVIKKAVEEVNLYADFLIEPKYEKKGRVVAAIKFLITPKEREYSLNELSPSSDELIAKLQTHFNFSDKEIQKQFQKYERSYIEEKVNNILNSETFKNGHIKNMPGFLKTALNFDFKTSVSSKDLIEKLKTEKEIKAIEKKKCEKLKEQYYKYVACNLKDLINLIDDDIRNSLLVQFEKNLPISCAVSFYDRGFDDILVRDRFVDFLKDKSPEVIQIMVSFEDYKRVIDEN